MISVKEILKEQRSNKKFNNWVWPSDEDLELEWKLEYKNKDLKSLIGRDVWPTARDFVLAARSSKTTNVSRSMDSKIGYRSHTKSREQLINLLKSYKSWPKYRNEKSVERMYNGFETNSPMPMPIVLDINGKFRVFGGNTRMDAANHLGITPKVILVKIPLD